MNAKLKELYDQKGQKWAQMQDVARKLKEGGTLTKEEETQFDGWDTELKSVTANIARLERADALEIELAASQLKSNPGNGGTQTEIVEARETEQNLTYRKAKEKGIANLSERERAVYNSMEIELSAFEKHLRGQIMDEAETKALAGLRKRATVGERAQSTIVAAGGYTIPQGFIAEVDQQLKFISPFFSETSATPNSVARSIFSYIPTETGNDLPFPTNNDTSNVGELLAENTDAFANTTDAVFGQVTFKAYKFNSKPMKVSNELLQDNAVNLPSLLAEMLGTRIARIANTYFTTGTNTAQPQGIVTGSTLGKTAASATAITFPEIIDLEHSVDAAYRKSSSARFMFNDLILAYLKKLTIGSATNDSRPVWQPGFAFGAPDTVDGFQYLVNNDMASTVATTNKTILFGDMSKFAIRQVRNMVFKRLDERFADLDQTAWLLFVRMDSKYKNTSAIKHLVQ